jgi:hypothetical protein
LEQYRCPGGSPTFHSIRRPEHPFNGYVGFVAAK